MMPKKREKLTIKSCECALLNAATPSIASYNGGAHFWRRARQGYKKKSQREKYY
jgi:hypothetical protein